MFLPLLITAGVLGGIAAFAPRVSAPAVPPNGTLPPPRTNMPPGTEMPPPAGRTIRIDPSPEATQIRMRARVGDVIQMHGVSRRSETNDGGYTFTPGRPLSERLFDLPIDPQGRDLLREEGPNDFRIVSPGIFTIRWAPNYVVSVEVEP